VASSDAVDRLIQQWRDELPEIVSAHLEAAKRLQLAAVELERHVRPVLAEHGLDAGEFDGLAALLRQGPPHELAPSALAREALVSTSGMTKRLDRLERRGLVRRRPDPRDRRAVLVSLSDEGVALARQAVPRQAHALRAALAALDDRQVSALADLLRPVADLTRSD
jgi:DNA-binding MarR family transcriptional regulator